MKKILTIFLLTNNLLVRKFNLHVLAKEKDEIIPLAVGE
jgi:hypothetical protein